MGEPTADARRRGLFTGDVVENRRLCEEHFLVRLALPCFPPTRAGQFVQLQCRDLREQIVAREVDWTAAEPPRPTQPELTDREPFLRRPFSIAGRRDAAGHVEIDLIYRTIGVGTRWLSRAGAGRRLSLIGPLGNAFTVHEARPAAAVVGGGVGIPPMLYLAEELARAGKKTVAFAGVRSGPLLPLTLTDSPAPSPAGAPTPCIEEFTARGAEAVVCTDDGSLGRRGFVSEAFARWLDGCGIPPADLAVYACGPEAMMRRVGQTCAARGVTCELALERYMACGMGTCQSCVFKMRADNEQGWAFKLVCTDGPVFQASDILWD